MRESLRPQHGEAVNVIQVFKERRAAKGPYGRLPAIYQSTILPYSTSPVKKFR